MVLNQTNQRPISEKKGAGMAENSERGRYLYIMRHGAADSDCGVLNDFNRPLSQKGIRETIRLIELMQQKKLRKPDCILCSTALRARQTTELLRRLFPEALVLYREGLYLAPVFRIISALNEMDNIFETVMVVGHHPGLEQAISYLTESVDQPVLQPSDCAVVRLPYPCAWRSLLPGVGQMHLFLNQEALK